MTKDTYDDCQVELLAIAQGIADAKRPGYTQANTDVLHNFKTVATLVGISPLQVWAVYYLKHVQAVLAHAMNPDIKQGEPIQGRFADLINYTLLGHSIWAETAFESLRK